MVFNFTSTLFQLYHSTQCKYPCYVRDYFTRIPHIIVSEQLAAFSHSQHGNNGEWGMNPVAMTIINPRERNWPSIDRTNNLLLRVLCTTMCYMSLAFLWMNHRLWHQCLYLQTTPKKILCSDPLPNNPDFVLFSKRPNVGLVPVGWICRRQNRCDSKIEICVRKDGKHCGKRWKCLLPAFSSLNSPITNLDQSKNLLFGKGLKILWCLWLDLELWAYKL